MSIFLLNKDIVNIILEKCVDYSDWSEIVSIYSGQPTLLRYIARFGSTCKYINRFAQVFINNNTYVYHIYQKDIERPDIVDHCGVVYKPSMIGYNLWFLCIKSSLKEFMYVDSKYYDMYDQSQRYFEENVSHLAGKLNSVSVQFESFVRTFAFNIHYKANFGEVILLTWYYNYYPHTHQHIKLMWTENDIWIGIINVYKAFSDIRYRYEVCVDGGGPIIRKEKEYKPLLTNGNKDNYVITDVWDCPHPLKF